MDGVKILKKLERSPEFHARRYGSSERDNPRTGNIIITISTVAVWEDRHGLPPSSYQCFVLYPLMKGIL
jgi:hypothetical protein